MRGNKLHRVAVSRLSGVALFLIFSFLVSSISMGRVINVPSDYPSMQEAVSHTSSYDTVLVAPGTYPGIRYFATENSPIGVTLMGSGWPNGTVIIESPLNPDHNAFTISYVSGWRITNFEITQCGDAIHPFGVFKMEIDHNYMHGMSMAYWSCAIEGDSVMGISIHHNLATDCEYLGFLIGADATCNPYHEIRIYNNTIDNIYSAEGIQFRHGDPSGCIVTNNIITDCAGQGIEFAYCNQGTAIVSYNCIYGTNGPFQNVTNPGSGNLLESPQFLLEPTIPEYYYLNENSPCIDTGNPDPIYNDPDGSRSDMGAFPYALGAIIHLIIDWVDAFPGDTVDVPMTISDVTGLDVMLAELAVTYPSQDLDLLAVSIPENSLPHQAGWILDYDDLGGTIIIETQGSTPITGSGLFCVMTYVVGEDVLPHTSWSIDFQSAILNGGAYVPATTNGGIRLPGGIIYGDVNMNGYVTLTDASMLFNYLCGGVQLNPYQRHVAEVSGEMGINAYDGALITQNCFQYITLFPVEGGNVESYAEGILSIPELTANAGEELEVPILVQNAINVAALQAMMTMGGQEVEVTEIVGPGQGAWFCRYAGTYPNYNLYLGGSEAVNGNQTLFTLTIQIPDTVSANLSIQLSNIMLNETEIPGQVYREIIIHPTAVQHGELVMPNKYSFAPPYPNPFNPSTNLVFDVPHTSPVKLTIYNSLGQVVEVLESGTLPAGEYTRAWDASRFSSGIYIAEFVAQDYRQIRKLLLVK
jgi:hypothetical protein